MNITLRKGGRGRKEGVERGLSITQMSFDMGTQVKSLVMALKLTLISVSPVCSVSWPFASIPAEALSLLWHYSTLTALSPECSLPSSPSG